MEIKIIDNQNTWQKFFDENNSPSFLHSWAWGEFQEKQGNQIIRIGAYDKNELCAITLVIKIHSKRGNFLFIPHGPIIRIQNLESRIKNYELRINNILSTLVNYLAEVAKKEKFDFIRIAPILLNTQENKNIFRNFGFKNAPIYMHAERIWQLPLNLPEDRLLEQMRKSTRYSINRAIRENVVIEKRTDQKAVDDFLKIYKQTASREQFIPFSRKFIKDEFETFNQNNNALFLFAKIVSNEETIAATLVVFTKSTAFYHQGATTHSKIPGSHLLQWEAIKEAKKRGCQFYNFWGIHQPGRTPKNWDGLTLFKQGFGGEQVDYLTTQDLILSPKYYLTYWYEKYLNWKRGV